jgi:tetratricopeptide (TPR) repeat protein
VSDEGWRLSRCKWRINERQERVTEPGSLRIVIPLMLCLIVSACASTTVSHYNLGVENYTRGKLPEAIAEYKEAARLNPQDPRPVFNLAVIYQDQGRDKEAAELYESILRQHPAYAQAMVNLASIQESGGNNGKAEELLKRSLEMDRDTCSPPSQYGFFLLRANREEDAEAAFKEALRRDATCANAYFGLGSIASRAGDNKLALSQFQEVIHYNPSDLSAHLKAAELLIDQGKRSEAIALLKKAAAIDSRRAETFMLLGRLLSREQAWKDAEQAVEKALSLGAPPRDCYLELSRIYQKLAEEACNSCSPLTPPAANNDKGENPKSP